MASRWSRRDRVLAIVNEVEKSDIPAWEDKPIPTSLMAKLPTPGKIVKEKKIDAIGVTEWTLSNGAKVIVKPTDFEKDTVLLGAVSPGGTATVGDKDFENARFASTVAQIGGAGDNDADTVTKILAGKQVSVSLQMSETQESVNANASAKDVEAMFQLLYVRITQPRKDVDVFKTWTSEHRRVLEERGALARVHVLPRFTGRRVQEQPAALVPEGRRRREARSGQGARVLQGSLR